MTARPFARRGPAVALLVGLALALAACDGSPTSQSNSASSMSSMPGMSGMDDMNMGPASTPPPDEAAPVGDGLAASIGGYTFVPSSPTVPGDAPSTFTYHVTGPDGRVITRYQPYQSKLMLFYLIRSDLTGYQHFDPAMHQDGTWSVSLPKLAPGSYRGYVAFAAPEAHAGKPLRYLLSQTFTVPGGVTGVPLPASAASTTVDGFVVALSGLPKSGVSGTVHIRITSGGKPVSYFQPYLDGYAHVAAFHVGDLAFAHLSPPDRPGGHGDVDLTSQALFPASGSWRLFVQFRTNGPVHTAAFTVRVG